MIVRHLQVLSASSFNGSLFALIKKGRDLALALLGSGLSVKDEVYVFSGSHGFILWGDGREFLVGVDDSLFLVRGNEARPVLRAGPGNFFWHAVEVGGKVFIHEYGEPPTGIYVSEDLEHWVKVVDNKAVDEYSRHFHFIGYDPYRDWLVATLGDANPIRVVYSPDLGRTWRRLYVGPWQFVPFIALGDRLVFGMDSGVARGGVGVYYPNSDRWSFRFLRFVHGRASVVQFSSLIKVNDLWVAALGSPQVFVASRDLNNWFLLYAEGYSTDYNHHMGVIPAGDSVIGFTGESIVLFNVDELGNYFNPPPAVITYLGITDRVKGLGFRVKRLFRR